MEFRYLAIDGAPPPQFYPVPPPFSCAPLPPSLPYYDSYFPPPLDAAYPPLPHPADRGYFASHDFRGMLDYRPRNPFLEREYEKERIREEILREEVRRRILKEEVRWELEMERYYGLRYPILGYHGTWPPAVQFEQPKYSDGCYNMKNGLTGQVSRNSFEGRRRRGKQIPHKIMEINEEELNGNRVAQRDVSEIPQKIMEVQEEELRPQQALLSDNAKPPKRDKVINQEELKPKEAMPEQVLPKENIKPPPNRKKLEKKKDGRKVLKPENGNKVEQLTLTSQSSKKTLEELHGMLKSAEMDMKKVTDSHVLAVFAGDKKVKKMKGKAKKAQVGITSKVKPKNCECSYCKQPGHWKKNCPKYLADNKAEKELLEEAEPCGSKRKADSTENTVVRKSKKQKTGKEKFNCAFCNITVENKACWLSHLNGKKHRNMLKRRSGGEKLETNKKETSSIDKKMAPGVELTAVKVEMDKECTPAVKPTTEEFKTDKQTIKKMQVGRMVHEVVERENRLWCDRCRYSCTTNLMMTIHLVSERHKANCQKK